MIKKSIKFRKIGFVDHLDRKEWSNSKQFFYDLIQESIKNYFDIETYKSLRFEMEKYENKNWLETYENINDDDVNMYENYILNKDICFSYEISPSVRKILEKVNIKYCDFRISPIRFLKDLVIAVRTNDKNIMKKLEKISIKEEEIKCEVIKMKASYTYKNFDNDINDKRLIFVGQTEEDASLVYNNKIARIDDFEKEIKTHSEGLKLYYLPHPAASMNHINNEIAFLKKINISCQTLTIESYKLLSLKNDDIFIGISSGLLQEAKYFNKKSISLIEPICNVAIKNDDFYFQISFETFLSKEFLGLFLGINNKIKKVDIKNIESNELRFLHNAWWGYAKYLTQPSQLIDSLLSHDEFIKIQLEGIKKIFHYIPCNSSVDFENKMINHRWIWKTEEIPIDFKDKKVFLNNDLIGEYFTIKNDEKNILVIFWNSGWVDFCEWDEENKRLNISNAQNMEGHAYIQREFIKTN